MAVDGITGGIQAISYQQVESNPDAQAATKNPSPPTTSQIAEDTFTPSAQNPAAQATAQDAGIFQPNPGTLLTNTAANPAQNGTPSQTPSAPTNPAGVNAQAAQTAPIANAGTAGNGAQAAAASANAANLQSEIQALNFALPELGLTDSQIEQIDRIASLINDFNPSAYAYLVNQFQAQARQSAQQTAANGTATGSAAAGAANAGTSAGPGANGTGFQVRQVSIHFTAPAAPNGSAANSNGQGTTSNNAQSNSSPLQLQQVLFTFANSNGQTFQVQAPQQTTAASASRPAPLNQIAYG